MEEYQNKFGYSIFSGLEKNTYLNEIYNALLYNDFLKLFNINDFPTREINIEDALRFADLLSKSVYSQQDDQHKSLAQEIVTLLDTLYPNDAQIKYVMGSVLSNTSNYLGLKNSVPEYAADGPLDKMSEAIIKEYLQIPLEEDSYFLQSQKKVYEHMEDDTFFSYSGPTSMGKSFVMRTFIKELIHENSNYNFAILVPTKALINEVSKELTDSLGHLLREKDYRVITSAGATILQEKNEHKYIFVMTPERLMYQLIGYREIQIHYLFVDEAQNISEKNGRSAFYYQVIGMLNHETEPPHIIFASPHIPNPDVYLGMIPSTIQGDRAQMTSLFTPVSQEKFLIDFSSRTLGYYNSLQQELYTVHSFDEEATLCTFISSLGNNKKNLIYCNAKHKVVDYARNYAATLNQTHDEELLSLAKEIRDQVHESYYLADTIEKGVAFHVGYLPTNIRLRIEESFRRRSGGIHTLFCTSTLLEGVNLPADNLFITDYRNGNPSMSAVEFRNLIGRVGRIQYSLFGNVYLVCMPGEKTKPENYVSLLKKDVEKQNLSVVSITDEEKNYVLDCLKHGVTKLEKLKNQTNDQYSLMRKAANILLRDIILDRQGSIRREFEKIMKPGDASVIKENFKDREKEPDDDINVSVDQVERVYKAIEDGLDYPKINAYGYINFNAAQEFLEKLCTAFDWENYEKSTLGHVKDGKHNNLGYYTTLLIEWLEGNGIKYMIESSIAYKNGKNISINGKKVKFDNSVLHRNIVIEDTLDVVNDIILFRISNYFMRFSTELKKYKRRTFLTNDWYEYVEYGTTNKICILLQKNGFSPEIATYIQKHEDLYIIRTDEGVRILPSLLECEVDSVRGEAEAVYNNMPELFDEVD